MSTEDYCKTIDDLPEPFKKYTLMSKKSEPEETTQPIPPAEPQSTGEQPSSEQASSEPPNSEQPGGESNDMNDVLFLMLVFLLFLN